jgi:hypothetical protein
LVFTVGYDKLYFGGVIRIEVQEGSEKVRSDSNGYYFCCGDISLELTHVRWYQESTRKAHRGA